MDFETEEQQLDAIKKWWNDNVVTIVGGITVGVAGIFGWQYYQEQSIVHANQASVIYEQVLTNVTDPTKVNTQLEKVNQLEAEYADTPYASLTAMLVSKQHLAAGEVVKAQQQLQWVIDNTSQEELRYLSKVRMARLLLASSQLDQALALLNENYPPSFKAMALELKGDVLLTQGKAALAKTAYNQAKLLSDSGNRFLQLKIDDLGDVAVENVESTTGKSEPSA